jgi:hypothetical protein
VVTFKSEKMSFTEQAEKYKVNANKQINAYLDYIRKVKAGREALDEIYGTFHNLKEALGGLGTVTDEHGRRIPAPYVPYLLEAYINALNVLKKYKDKEELRDYLEKGRNVLKSKLPYVIEAAELYKGALKERIEEKTEVERKEIDATQTKVREMITKFDELLKELDC